MNQSFKAIDNLKNSQKESYFTQKLTIYGGNTPTLVSPETKFDNNQLKVLLLI